MTTRVEISGENDAYEVTFPDQEVAVWVDRIIEDSKFQVYGRIEVKDTRSTTSNPHLLDSRLNFTSVTGKNSIARYLKTRLNHLDWDAIIEATSVKVMEKRRLGTPPIVLRDYSDDGEPQYAIHPIIVMDEWNLLIGDGEATKSLLLLACGMSLNANEELVPGLKPLKRLRTLVCDWETNERTYYRRLKRLAEGIGLIEVPDIMYRRCSGPLHEEKFEIKRIIIEEGIDLLIGDSLSYAAGGDLKEQTSADMFTRSLRWLNITSIWSAHVTKDKDRAKDGKAFGSNFWHAGPRNVFEIIKHQETGKSYVDVALFHRKSNDDAKVPPFGYRLNFGPTQTWYEPIDVTDVPELAQNGTLLDQIKAILKNGAKPVKELSEKTGKSESLIRKTLNVNKDICIDFPGPGGSKKWGLRT